MVAIELVKDLETKEPATLETKAIIKQCNQAGLIIIDAGIHGNVIRFLMPLCLTDDQLNAGLDILENAIHLVSQ